MGSFSLMHWVVVLIVVMLLFGGGRISSMMGDVAKGIKNFKKGLVEDEDMAANPPPATPAPRLETKPTETLDPTPAATRNEQKLDG